MSLTRKIYGYRSVNKELQVEPTEAEIVRLIFDKYIQDDGTLNGVAIWLNDNGYTRICKDTEYIVMRKQPYVDRAYGNWSALNNQLIISYKENGITKQVREGEERNIINGILPQSLSGYFFFDTERVSDISTRKDLSEAVRGLLGLAAVGNARKHLGSRTLKGTAIG